MECFTFSQPSSWMFHAGVGFFFFFHWVGMPSRRGMTLYWWKFFAGRLLLIVKKGPVKVQPSVIQVIFLIHHWLHISRVLRIHHTGPCSLLYIILPPPSDFPRLKIEYPIRMIENDKRSRRLTRGRRITRHSVIPALDRPQHTAFAWAFVDGFIYIFSFSWWRRITRRQELGDERS